MWPEKIRIIHHTQPLRFSGVASEEEPHGTWHLTVAPENYMVDLAGPFFSMDTAPESPGQFAVA